MRNLIRYDVFLRSWKSWISGIGNTLYFETGNASGRELWKSDGTVSGTVMVKDINSGSGNSDPSDLSVIDGILYFAANDGVHGLELWRRDGTPSGTYMVKDINSGSNWSQPMGMFGLSGGVIFSANDGDHGRELHTDLAVITDVTIL